MGRRPLGNSALMLIVTRTLVEDGGGGRVGRREVLLFDLRLLIVVATPAELHLGRGTVVRAPTAVVSSADVGAVGGRMDP